MVEPKHNIGDTVRLADGRGPFTIRWSATFYRRVKYWLEEIGGVFDERQLEEIDDAN